MNAPSVSVRSTDGQRVGRVYRTTAALMVATGEWTYTTRRALRWRWKAMRRAELAIERTRLAQRRGAKIPTSP